LLSSSPCVQFPCHNAMVMGITERSNGQLMPRLPIFGSPVTSVVVLSPWQRSGTRSWLLLARRRYHRAERLVHRGSNMHRSFPNTQPSAAAGGPGRTGQYQGSGILPGDMMAPFPSCRTSPERTTKRLSAPQPHVGPARPFCSGFSKKHCSS